VALVIGTGVLIHFDEHQARIAEMALYPVGVHEYVRTAHA
jgi:hypothetical protein